MTNFYHSQPTKPALFFCLPSSAKDSPTPTSLAILLAPAVDVILAVYGVTVNVPVVLVVPGHVSGAYRKHLPNENLHPHPHQANPSVSPSFSQKPTAEQHRSLGQRRFSNSGPQRRLVAVGMPRSGMTTAVGIGVAVRLEVVKVVLQMSDP